MCFLHHNTSHLLLTLLYFPFFLSFDFFPLIHSFMSIYTVLEKRAIFSSLLNMRVTKSNCSCVKKNRNSCGSALCFKFSFSQFFHSFVHSFFCCCLCCVLHHWNNVANAKKRPTTMICMYWINSKLQFYRKCYLAFDLPELSFSKFSNVWWHCIYQVFCGQYQEHIMKGKNNAHTQIFNKSLTIITLDYYIKWHRSPQIGVCVRSVFSQQ